MSGHADEVSAGARFEFGANWRRFLDGIDEARIEHASASLSALIGTSDLAGRRFLDAGCGSGIFSLAALRMGASVVSFDYDPASVACAEELRRRFAREGADWTIREGSVLDEAFLASLGSFDVVYSWGVLHHTGAMWTALDRVAARVRAGGTLAVAIYNEQGKKSRRWLRVKRAYNRLPTPLRFLVLGPSFLVLWGPQLLRDTVKGNPLRTWRGYGAASTGRGMSPWRDVVDWVGGFPYEVARPEEVFAFCRDRGFTLRFLRTEGAGLGCNELVFTRQGEHAR